MIAGVAIYFLLSNIVVAQEYRIQILSFVKVVQPCLIFAMLFLSFSKIDIRDMRLRRWHLWLLLIQLGSFVAMSLISSLIPRTADYRVLLEAAMICMICPTATASAVIVKKLDGSAEDVTAYTMLINIFNAIVVPLCVPMVHPQPGMSFIVSSLLIIGKVFPLLILPLIAAVIIRWFLPKLHDFISRYFYLSFYLWAIALSLAISVTTRTIVHTHLSIAYQVLIAIVSLICCLIQFYYGKKIGRRYGDSITAGQALGQKNTVFAIWMGYTFFTPITSIAGGFYSVWHNIINSYQLYQKRKK